MARGSVRWWKSVVEGKRRPRYPRRQKQKGRPDRHKVSAKRRKANSRFRDCDGLLDLHHVLPRSRVSNTDCVYWNVPFHTWWHALFMNMTVAEAVWAIEHVMTHPCPKPIMHGQWGWKDWTRLRGQVIRRTDDLVAMRPQKRHGLGVVPAHYMDGYRPARNVPIDLHCVSEAVAEMWMLVFGQIPTLYGVVEFIQNITVVGEVYPWSRILQLRQRAERAVALAG